VAQFPSLKAKKLVRVLEAQPLGYRVVRQKGSHRKLEAPNHPPITWPSTTTRRSAQGR
jgi:predicted RNA binding protein YcfA (HicA-like mRNA interferase family)